MGQRLTNKTELEILLFILLHGGAGYTVIFVKCRNHAEVVEVLVTRGANLRVFNRDRKVPANLVRYVMVVIDDVVEYVCLLSNCLETQRLEHYYNV